MEKFLIRSNLKGNNKIIDPLSIKNSRKRKAEEEQDLEIKHASLNICSQIKEKDEKSVKKFKESDGIPKDILLEKGLPHCSLEVSRFSWHIIKKENLNLKYAKIFSKGTADNIFQKLEEEVKYFSGDLLKVKIFGKWHTIPRKQVSFGDPGLSYAFSGNCIPALPWDDCNIIGKLKEIVESVCQHSFNFVLVNRYKNGLDYMGEHRDNEKDLNPHSPIASLSFGQKRDFIFRHKDAHGSKSLKKIDTVKLELEHGSLLLMNWPTNHFWYHKLPVRKNSSNVRINLTFRQMVKK